MPEGGELLASSDYGEYDIYKIGNRVLCMQTHPEFTEFFLDNHILKRIFEQEIIDGDYLDEIRHNLYAEDLPSHGSTFLKMIRLFMKNSLSVKED